MTPARVTLFACPKAFHGHTGVIQRNAIGSWCRLDPRPEIILVSDDDGVAEVAAELGVVHIPGVETSDAGTPRLDSIFRLAEERSSAPVLGYINADIILLDDFAQAMTQLDASLVERANQSFLLCTRRLDIDLETPIDFENSDWAGELRELVEQTGVRMNDNAIDMFVYSRSLYDDLLPLALGRTAWDNYLLFRARERGAIVVNGGDCFSLIHQSHDYGKVGWHNAWMGPEAVRNRELVGESMMTIGEAGTHVLGGAGLVEGSLEPRFEQAVLGLQRLDLALKEVDRGNEGAAEDHMRDARQWLKGVPEEVRFLRTQAEDLKGWVAELEKRATAQTATIEGIDKERSRLRGELERLLASWSWRLTKPLRLVGRFVS